MYACMIETKSNMSGNNKCVDCGGLKLDWQTRCVDCYKIAQDTATPRPCSQCKEDKLTTADPDWRKLCRDCYIENTKDNRQCSVCSKPRISPDKPVWQNVCTGCYIEKKKQTHTTCPTCPKERSTWLTRLHGEAQCKQCVAAK